jgi:chemotaxis protein methyltransferase WspC
VSYAEFESLLKQLMGLDAASIGSQAVERAVQTRMSVCASNNLSGYWELVRASATEQQELVEAVVVPETWFFRDREAFAALARIVHNEWLPTHPQKTLRLLSLPCSSGEEPYSMAMALLDAGVPADRYRVDAFDISGRVLRHAQRAIYGKNSFRGAELGFRERHFEATSHGYQLRESVRQQVQFHQANMFGSDLPAGTQIYDAIFCRNLLIYFDRATQDRAVMVLQRLLGQEGVLFVGPSETGLLLSHDFVSARVPLAFAFRKLGKTPPAAMVAPTRKLALRRAAPTVLPADIGKAGAARRPDKPVAQVVKPDRSIEAACSLADQGHMAEAARVCQEHLLEHGPSAQAYHLMGLIRSAAGNLSEADQYYRKALYLDPNHYDTLLHLALLLEKRGAAAGAQVLRDRLSRLERKLAN